MTLRGAIFTRTVLLLGALIMVCCLGMAVFTIDQNRRQWRGHAREEARFIAGQSERLLLWDDPLALRDMMLGRKGLDSSIEYIFVEAGGAPYAHTFAAGVPSGLIGRAGPKGWKYMEREVQDGEGRVFYDEAAPVGGTGAVVHLGLSRDRVDDGALPLLGVIAAVCGAAWLLCIIPAWYSSAAITREVERSTQALARLNEELEARVRERTSELSDANEMLKKEMANRERLEKEKAEFYAMVTHDLKSPLTVIRGYAELALEQKKDMDEDLRGMMAGIARSAQRLFCTVNEFLTVSRLEQGGLALNRSAFGLDGLVREAVKDSEDVFRDKDITAEVETEEGLPAVSMDRAYVQRALANLLQNAAKYTPVGGRVSVAARLSCDEKGCVEVSVRDTGAGIPPEEQDKVFEKYYRLKTSAGAKGTGLGLYIVKMVAEAHGGRVELRSEPGKGSEFRMILPVQA